MPGLSVHVVDIARGVPAAGMRVEIWSRDGAPSMLAEGAVATNGVAALGDLATRSLAVGQYEAVFHVATWYRAQGVALPAVPYLDRVGYAFGISDSAQHYHLPFKVSPWGYSLFRGGA